MMSEAARVHVACRFRPLNSIERSKGARTCVVLDKQSLELTTGDGHKHAFSFDQIFGSNASQREVYEGSAAPLVQAVLQGFHANVLAYGQTGAGKTHSMLGPSPLQPEEDEQQLGIIPRAVADIFRHVACSDPVIEWSLSCTFVEVYCERVRDLLCAEPCAGHDDLKIGEAADGSVFLKEVCEVPVTCEEEVLELMDRGGRKRATAATGMNAGSSRSHSIFAIRVLQTDKRAGQRRVSKLTLVDLAGSETVAKTGVTGVQLEELKKINRSLSALGLVIYALTDPKATHVPYRDSKLTRLLQDSLGGNSRTTLLVHASPASYNELETLSSLRFGKRAKSIRQMAVVNVEQTAEALRGELERARAALAKYQQREEEWVHAVQRERGALGAASQLLALAGVRAPSPQKVMPQERGDDDDDDDDDGNSEEDAVAAAQAEAEAQAAVAASLREELQGVCEEREELSAQNATLLTLLQEAGGEMKQLKAALDSRDARIRELEAAVLAADAAASQRADAGSTAGEGGEAGTSGSSRAADAELIASLQSELEVLRHNYHVVLSENEELSAEVASLRVNVTECEEARSEAEARAEAAETAAAVAHERMAAQAAAAAAAAAPASDAGASPLEATAAEYLVVEECYENEAYHAGSGSYSSNLREGLDPPSWSDAAGLVYLPRSAVHLPDIGDSDSNSSSSGSGSSNRWVWVDDWHVDEAGWRYAAGFPTLTAAPAWPAGEARAAAPGGVRRRRWTRTRVCISVGASGSGSGGGDISARQVQLLVDRITALEGAVAGKIEELSRCEARLDSLQAALQQQQQQQQAHRLSNVGAGGSMPPLSPSVPSAGGRLSSRFVAVAAHSPRGAGLDAGGGGDAGGFLKAVLKRLSSAGSPVAPPPHSPGGVGAATGSGSGSGAAPDPAARTAEEKAADVADMLRHLESGAIGAVRDMLAAGLVDLRDPAAAAAPGAHTAMLLAARTGSLPACQLLLRAGWDVHAVDEHKRTALHYAARRGHVDVVSWLLQQGVSATVADKHSLAPLHQAVLAKSAAVCQLLLKAGADLQAKDTNGFTPLTLATKKLGQDDDSRATLLCLQKWAAANPAQQQ